MIEHSPLLERIRLNAETYPSKTAIVLCSGEGISYSLLWENIKKWVSYILSIGFVPGDRIMLSANKEVEFLYAYLGNHLAGLVNVVVDASSNKDHLQYIASMACPRLSIGVELSGFTSYPLSYISSALAVFRSDSSFGSSSLSSEDIADIMFTSGTTGNPKGVLLTHSNIYGSANNINKFIGNTSDDIEFLALPICHSFGLGRLRCSLIKGATVVLHNGFANLKSVFSTIERYHITGFGMVPAVWAYIKRFSGERIGKYANQIKYIEIGSSAMSTADKEMLMHLFPTTRICMHYGLTEASRALFMEMRENSDNLSTIGRPTSPEIDVKVMDENGVEVPDGESGEICIKGNMVSLSYLDAQDNEGAFRGKYFRTGDGGRKDNNGLFYLEARIKELINVGGKKVSPIEIENVLEELGVKESICLGVPDPDGVLGEVPKVMILRDSYTGTIEDLRKKLIGKLESYKIPREFEIVDSIPMTANGKKKRNVRN